MLLCHAFAAAVLPRTCDANLAKHCTAFPTCPRALHAGPPGHHHRSRAHKFPGLGGGSQSSCPQCLD